MAKKKLKKFLKSAAKAALIGGALYGGSKLGRKRATDAPGDAAAAAKKLLTSDRAYTGGTYEDPIMTGGVGVKHSPRRKWTGNQSGYGDMWMKGGGRIGAKKGGHVKSMGVAKRGGGVAKR